MRILIDGSNVLGRSRASREDVEVKRSLVRDLSRYAAHEKVSIEVFFDGPEEASFGKALGKVHVRFSRNRPADDLIVEAIDRKGAGQVHVVSDDQALLRRVAGRMVKPISVAELRRRIESIPISESLPAAELVEDWERYFSDPQNRGKS